MRCGSGSLPITGSAGSGGAIRAPLGFACGELHGELRRAGARERAGLQGCGPRIETPGSKLDKNRQDAELPDAKKKQESFAIDTNSRRSAWIDRTGKRRLSDLRE